MNSVNEYDKGAYKMADMWFRLKEMSEYIKNLESYIEAWNFIREVAEGDLYEVIDRAQELIDTYKDATKND